MKTKKTKSVIPKVMPVRRSSGLARRARVTVKTLPESALRVKKILVPTDFSAESKKALNYAQAFAQQLGSALVLLHVVETLVYPGELGYGSMVLPEMTATLQENGKTRLEMLAKEELSPSIPVRTEVRVGTAFNEITAAAKEHNVDLIVLATHGYTGLKHVLLGSTAERVVRYSPCPVLTVRVRGHEFI